MLTEGDGGEKKEGLKQQAADRYRQTDECKARRPTAGLTDRWA